MSSSTIIEELADDLEMQRRETDNLRRAYVDVVAELRDMECRLDTAYRKVRQAKEESRETRDTYLDLKEQNDALKIDHSDLEKEMAALSRDYKSLRDGYFELEGRLAKRRRRD
jgi:chromosome segregation ATPase